MVPYLQVNNLHYSINGQEIIKGLSFVVEKGDILVIIGPNGSGKTTLLKNIIGAVKPTTGEILIAGLAPEAALGKIGYVPQNFDFDRLTPINVREFMGLERCTQANHSPAHISDALQKVGLKGREEARIGVLSGGEFQRLMIARALLHEKELLIFDEPSAGIDVAGEETVYSLIADISRETGATCIIVSHELNIVNKYAKSVLCLNKEMVCFGHPETAITTEALQAMYGPGAGLYHHHNH